AAAIFPLVSFWRGLAPGLSLRRYGVSSPRFLARMGIEGGHEAADPELASRCAHHNLAAGDKRSQRDVVAGLVIRDPGGPGFSAGSRVDRHQDGFARRVEHLVAVERNAPIGLVRHHSLRRPAPAITPEDVP